MPPGTRHLHANQRWGSRPDGFIISPSLPPPPPPPCVQNLDPVTTYGHIQLIGERVRARMANNTYVAKVDKAIHECLDRLSWWNNKP